MTDYSVSILHPFRLHSSMATLTLKNVPEQLIARLREAATRNNRSLNREVITQLETSNGATPRDVGAMLGEIRAVRERMTGVYVTDAAVRDARAEGRE